MEAFALLKRRPWGIAGAAIVLAVILMAAMAPLVAPYGVNYIGPRDRLTPPGEGHLLGTDVHGHDVFSQVLYGARPYVIVGALGTASAVVLGGLFGFIAARTNRKTGSVLRVAAFSPVLFFATIVLLIEGVNMPRVWALLDYLQTLWVRLFPGVEYPWFLFSGHFALSVLNGLGLFWNPRFIVPLMAAILAAALLPSFFVQARRSCLPARNVGEILPGRRRPNAFLHCVAVVVSGFAVACALAILFISPGDYFGIGMPPPAPTWGGMLNEAGRPYVQQAGWVTWPPTLALWLTIPGSLLFLWATREAWAPRSVASEEAEAKTPEPKTPGFWLRWSAALIDVAAFAVLGYGISSGLVLVAPAPVIFGISLAVGAGYLALFWLWAGATPGKLAMGIRIVPAAGPVSGEGGLGWKRVLLRMVGYLLSMLTLGAGFLFMAFDRNGRGLADRMAGTLVITRPAETESAIEH